MRKHPAALELRWSNMATPFGISLYDDWRARRERLLLPAAQAILPSAAAHVKVLEFLLSRYQNAEVVRLAAMFPLPRDLALNERAIILNHHLGSGRVAGVKSALEAEARVVNILSRMAAPVSSNDEDDTPWPGNSTLWSRAALKVKHRQEDRYLALASDDYFDRAWALNHFQAHGTLQDTGLLSDLAAIPNDDDQFARERRKMLTAMRVIGQRCRDARIAPEGRGG